MIETFNIKGMICSRCLKVLNNEFNNIGAEVMEISLGKIVIQYDPEKIGKIKIERIIRENEFEIIWDPKSILAEQIKLWIINFYWKSEKKEKLSKYLSRRLNKNYDQLSKVFSKSFGKTIERYGVLLRIERAKEYIELGELSFSEIAFKTGYSNLSSLSRQFKRETGLTMKAYKAINLSERIPIDKI